MRKILTVVGARPQFIKSAPVSQALGKFSLKEVIVHTGQHYDPIMSKIFFDQLCLNPPAYEFESGGLSHAKMTAKQIVDLEGVAEAERPDMMLVYGDTNSTLAGALVAAKMSIPIAHVESGLRSGDISMPEEINRLVVDRLSEVLFCPSWEAVENLKAEGVASAKIVNSGDVMLDALRLFSSAVDENDFENDSAHGRFVLMTLHRAANVDDEKVLSHIFSALTKIPYEVLLPAHPRLQKQMLAFHINVPPNLRIVQPVGYLQMLSLLRRCSYVITDSGGLQKEAYFSQKRCLVLRETTEWKELVEISAGFVINPLAWTGSLPNFDEGFDGIPLDVYGNGTAAEVIAERLSLIL